MNNSEAKKMAGEFIVGELSINEELWGFIHSKNPTISREDHSALYDVVDPIVREALKEIGDYLVYEAEREITRRAQQEARVKAVIEQFGLEMSDDNGYHMVNAEYLTDALFGATL